MPYQILPVRSTNEILGAAWLNALSDNIEWLYGAANGRNMPFQGYAIGAVDTVDASDCIWYFRMKAGLTHLHYSVTMGAGVTYLRIKVNDYVGSDVTLYANEAPPGTTVAFHGAVSIANLTVRRWHKLWVESHFIDLVNDFKVSRLLLADSDTLTTQAAATYTVPPRLERGDNLTAADMNLYKTALEAAHALWGDQHIQLPTRQNNTEDRGYQLVNRHRWLHYIGDGEIVDIQFGNPNVTLSGNGTNIVVYDLMQIEWMFVGLRYAVEDVTFCAEDPRP